MRPYFAYAINMDESGMARRCPGARFLGRARLPGHAFMICRDGLGTLVRQPGSEVHGVVWRIDRQHERALDDFEGVAHRQYLKAHLRVRLWEGGWVGCMAYLATNAEAGQPAPGYLEAVIAAAEAQRLPQPHIRALKRWQMGWGKHRAVQSPTARWLNDG